MQKHLVFVSEMDVGSTSCSGTWLEDRIPGSSEDRVSSASQEVQRLRDPILDRGLIRGGGTHAKRWRRCVVQALFQGRAGCTGARGLQLVGKLHEHGRRGHIGVIKGAS